MHVYMLFCSCCLLFSVVYFDCCAPGSVELNWTEFGISFEFWFWILLVQVFSLSLSTSLFHSFSSSVHSFHFQVERQRVGVCHRDFLIENLMNTCRQCIHCALTLMNIRCNVKYTNIYEFRLLKSKMNGNNFYSTKLRGDVHFVYHRNNIETDRTCVVQHS